jgi:hypothetical protein
MRGSLEPDSNVIVEREEQETKQDWPMNSRVEGRQIDDSILQPENAKSSIRESLESDSNVIVEKEVQ